MPTISRLTGVFVGGMRTNYGSFVTSKHPEMSANRIDSNMQTHHRTQERRPSYSSNRNDKPSYSSNVDLPYLVRLRKVNSNVRAKA
jgi:hypothetical protein